MDSAKKGVILVSFGSVAQSYRMLPEQKNVFLETFSEFPDITFIWKYENESENIAVNHKNVVTGKWLPQTDILGNSTC
jgi:UDP:flavonoid glycosyltransferase YjiC (YdhE family)